MSINQFLCVGTITKSSIDIDRDGRPIATIHVNVSCGPGRHLWVIAVINKKSLVENIAESLWPGNEITLMGPLAPRDTHAPEAVMMRATDARSHNITIEIVDDGRSTED